MSESIASIVEVVGHDGRAVYALANTPGESSRLRRQAEELTADSTALLDRVGVRTGAARDRSQVWPARHSGPAGRAGLTGGASRRSGC
jgi:hypothetical protein